MSKKNRNRMMAAAAMAMPEPEPMVVPEVQAPMSLIEKLDAAPKPPYRLFRATLPNGQVIEKRSRMNSYCAVIVVEREDGSFGVWRWTSQAKAINSQKNLAVKGNESAESVQALPVEEVSEALPSIEQVYESKKAAGSAAKLRGLKATDVEECEGGFRIKA